jgi:TonB family protein
MDALLVYMVKVALYLAAFFLVYLLFLKRDKVHSRNRAFLLISLSLSLILPLISITTNKAINIPVFGKILSDVIIFGSPGVSNEITSGKYGTNIPGIINGVYFTGVILASLKFIIDFTNLFFLILRQKNGSSNIIRFHNFNTSGFSALGKVFINASLTGEEADEVVKHEKCHLDHYHFFDILFIETLKVFQWFNPVIFLINKSLREVHEYQADEECLHTGISLVNYQKLLLNNVFRSQIFRITNSFSNPSLVKKRMVMMAKEPCGPLTNLKLLIGLPVIACVMIIISSYNESAKPEVLHPDSEHQAFAAVDKKTARNDIDLANSLEDLPPPPQNDSGTDTKLPPAVSVQPERRNASGTAGSREPFVIVEEMPMFPGGDAALLRFIGENTIYPEAAKAAGIQGRVIARFSIEADGSINNVSVLKGINTEINAEALRVIKSLPRFKPGRQNGIAVPVWYMVPITFTLK